MFRDSQNTAGESILKNPGKTLQGPETNPQTVALIHHSLRARVPFETAILNYDKTAKPYLARFYVMPFHDRATQSDYYVALALKLPDTEQSLFAETAFSEAAREILSLITA